MKKAHVEYAYDAGVAAVAPLLTAKDHVVDRFTAQGARNVEVVDHAEDDETTRLVARYVVDVDVPGFARRVLSPNSHVTHSETWGPSDDGGRAGDFEITVKGVPSAIKGRSALVPDGGGCRSVTDAEIVVSIPLIGGKLEQMGLNRLHEDLAKVDVYLRGNAG